MRVLEHLKPKSVFSYFEDLCGIPHGSRNVKAVSDYCVSFAKEHGLEWMQDDAYNVIIIKPATAGYEKAPAVMLQGHLDMVCEKDMALTDLDMAKTPLDIAIDGDYIYAKGTTLGGDDGIAVACMLAVLASNDLSHPRIEAVFTTDEEIGMLGAAAIDLSPLQAKLLINMDSEEEGIFLTSCAGGVTASINLPVAYEETGKTPVEITIDGLQGGHSGIEIDKGRGNANMLMGRLLNHMKQVDFRLAELKGGLKDNAIPLSCRAVIMTDDVEAVQQAVQEYEQVLRHEYRTSDPNVSVHAAVLETGSCALNADSTKRAVSLLTNVPNGVQAMSMDLVGLVETSLNLGILELTQQGLFLSFAVRSSVSSAKQAVLERLESIAELLGGTVELFGDYPAWEFKKDSRLREIMMQTYRDLYGKEPEIQAIHAGLECGIFSGKVEGLDCISLGPDMMNVHTSKERLSISSTARTWDLVVETLKRLKDF
ncbi:Cytosol non-specific dipeptidase [uncultured Ruminococcus sp.]|uniref:Cytosol non-specific dipeptidase n=1 Tax=Massiliimalia timonensis TaxID=1987501 RepID=A0A8J6P9V7_9FIRM|nr:aminoacyl-histidine dipeptidase [Massiliimalia timonensis]MBC8611984.1 aminoacyl-histidine dipeptidase [Massiliimalia timonensis]SCG97611.1 Cytosol non-specific dipeptidase [uncultured Clostridium sp.]SCH93685.1 Cytosol non-specific dipeptidase [uncultured Ruminococcus sp.]